MEVYEGSGYHPPTKKNKMGEIADNIDYALYELQLEVIKKAIAKKLDISYTDTDDGNVSISIKNFNTSKGFVIHNLPLDLKKAIDKLNEYKNKKKAKDEAKSFVKVKYKVGDTVILRGKIRDGSERIVKKFEVKKVIWSIHSNPVNILILKQLEGPNNNRSLDKNDCKKYHIKYEPGLQVYSMMLNFSKIKKK